MPLQAIGIRNGIHPVPRLAARDETQFGLEVHGRKACIICTPSFLKLYIWCSIRLPSGGSLLLFEIELYQQQGKDAWNPKSAGFTLRYGILFMIEPTPLKVSSPRQRAPGLSAAKCVLVFFMYTFFKFVVYSLPEASTDALH